MTSSHSNRNQNLVSRLFWNTYFPFFNLTGTERPSDGALILHYYSERAGLESIVIGIVKVKNATLWKTLLQDKKRALQVMPVIDYEHNFGGKRSNFSPTFE